MENKLYKKLCPKKGAVIRSYVKAALFLGIILVVGLFCCYAVYEEGDHGTLIVATVILMGLLALVGWTYRKEIRSRKQINLRKGERIANLTEADFEALENEILCEEMRYKTFYLLREYVYVPKDCLLLRYEEIGMWKSVRHTTNYIPDAAWVELTDTSGCMQKINIRQWRQYLMELESFVEELNDRKTQAMGADGMS